MALGGIASGYDLDWVEDPPDDLKCLICLCVARDPQQHPGDASNDCGRVFCTDCITEYKKEQTKCPNCRQNFTLFPDSRSARNINALKIKCNNEMNGCKWKGELGSQETHLESCDYALIPCTNQCMIDNIVAEILKKDLPNHLANDCPRHQYECPHCQETGEHQERTTTHLDTCPNVEIPCPNSGCQNKIARCGVQTHQSMCDYTLLACTNECKNDNKQIKRFFRKNLQNHLTHCCPRRQHQCLYCQQMGEYRDIVNTHRETCPNIEIECPNTNCNDIILRCNMETHRSTCDYECMSCKYATIGCEEKPLRKYLRKHEGNNQLHLQISLQCNLALAKVNSHLLRSTSLTPCTLKLTNYQQWKGEDKEFYSLPFYTFYSGYKMCLAVFANGLGIGAGTHVSVYAHLMKGDYDDTLTWPFTWSVTVELLNQLEDKNHYQVTFTFSADSTSSNRVVDGDRGIGYGSPQFIPHVALNYNAATNTQYLKDDTLVFRVSVEVPDHKPWLDCTM